MYELTNSTENVKIIQKLKLNVILYFKKTIRSEEVVVGLQSKCKIMTNFPENV